MQKSFKSPGKTQMLKAEASSSSKCPQLSDPKRPTDSMAATLPGLATTRHMESSKMSIVGNKSGDYLIPVLLRQLGCKLSLFLTWTIVGVLASPFCSSVMLLLSIHSTETHLFSHPPAVILKPSFILRQLYLCSVSSENSI